MTNAPTHAKNKRLSHFPCRSPVVSKCSKSLYVKKTSCGGKAKKHQQPPLIYNFFSFFFFLLFSSLSLSLSQLPSFKLKPKHKPTKQRQPLLSSQSNVSFSLTTLPAHPLAKINKDPKFLTSLAQILSKVR